MKWLYIWQHEQRDDRSKWAWEIVDDGQIALADGMGKNNTTMKKSPRDSCAIDIYFSVLLLPFLMHSPSITVAWTQINEEHVSHKSMMISQEKKSEMDAGLCCRRFNSIRLDVDNDSMTESSLNRRNLIIFLKWRITPASFFPFRVYFSWSGLHRLAVVKNINNNLNLSSYLKFSRSFLLMISKLEFYCFNGVREIPRHAWITERATKQGLFRRYLDLMSFRSFPLFCVYFYRLHLLFLSSTSYTAPSCYDIQCMQTSLNEKKLRTFHDMSNYDVR